jgi:putative transposase
MSPKEAIRTYLDKDCALGSGKFQDEVEAMVGRRVTIAPQGRLKQLADHGEK